MATDSDVVARLWLVVRGQQSLDEFEEWFITDGALEDTPLQREAVAILAESAGNVDDEVAIRELALLLPASLLIVGSGTVLSGAAPILEGFDESDFSTRSDSTTEPVPYSVPA